MKTRLWYNVLFFALLCSTLSCGSGSNEEDTYGVEKTNGLTYICEFTEVDGYRTQNDSFHELKYIGSNKFKIDGIEYSIVQAEKDFSGYSRQYILTLDKGKIIDGESFPLMINVNATNGVVTYDLWYRVYGVLFLSSFKAG